MANFPLQGEIAMALTGQAKTDYQRDYGRAPEPHDERPTLHWIIP
jgi:hypothetical protein